MFVIIQTDASPAKPDIVSSPMKAPGLAVSLPKPALGPVAYYPYVSLFLE
jgi:hypothetical protein